MTTAPEYDKMILLRTEYYGEDSRAASPFGGIAMKKMVFALLSYAILIGALPYNKSHNSHPEIPQDAQFSEAATDLHAVPESDENRGASKRNVAPGSYDSILQTYRKIVDLAPDLAEEKELCSEAIRNAVPSGIPGWIHSSGWQHPSSICIQKALKGGSRTVHPISVTRSKISTAMVLSN